MRAYLTGGESGDRVAPCWMQAPCAPTRHLLEGASCRPEPRRAFHNYVFIYTSFQHFKFPDWFSSNQRTFILDDY